MTLNRLSKLYLIVLIMGTASSGRADLLRVIDNHGVMVASCEGGCEIDIPGPVGDLGSDRNQAFFVADAENPLRFRTFLHWWGSEIADSYHITFEEYRNLLCAESEVGGCGFRSDHPLTTELDFFSPVQRPPLESYEVIVTFAPEPSTILLLGLSVGILIHRLRSLRTK